MKSVVLVPYCPLPADTGGKREMWKHLEVLRSLGECRIVSAGRKPVGAGWTTESRSEIEKLGYSVTLREESCKMSVIQILGVGYAAVCKALGLEKAFGHSNPYHSYAFPAEWWRRCTEGADLAVINYSYWSWLPCACPKAVALLDLWSDYMWEGPEKEIQDLSIADLVVVISKEEEKKLNAWGIHRTLWSPPAVKHVDLPLTNLVGCLGSANKFNIEGLRWLESASSNLKIKTYGSVSNHVLGENFERIGRYDDVIRPYRDCGIILLPTSGGMGVQIKAIESLAYGRAIVARKGAMRGLPEEAGGWMEVETPGEMIDAAIHLVKNNDVRARQAQAARDYYRAHLDADRLRAELRDKLLVMARTGRQAGSHT